MTEQQAELVGIGHAIVDILTYRDAAFLAEHALVHGTMTLIDEARAMDLYQVMGASTECSGGSAANTLAGFAMLGGSAAFMGKVRDDKFGKIFRTDLRRSGVAFPSRAAESGSPTAQCLIFVTEHKDAFGKVECERTMATYLGISGQITSEQLDFDMIAKARILFFEGYLWDSVSARDAVGEALAVAKKHGVKVAFTTSDPLCVERHHDAFVTLVKDHVDVLFANEREAETLFGESDIRKVLHKVNGVCDTVCITRSEQGSYVLQGGDIHSVDAEKVDKVYDVTGAGDLYAAGFLYGYAQGYSPEDCGRLGSKSAAEVIKYIGARPVTDLKSLIPQVIG